MINFPFIKLQQSMMPNIEIRATFNILRFLSQQQTNDRTKAWRLIS